MRPRYGNLLSPERWNPRLDIFYQELVIVSNTFRQGLEEYLAVHKGKRIPYHVLEDKSGLGITALRNLASGKIPYAPSDSYHSIASTLGLDAEVDPSRIRVRGAYIGMPAAYYFDHNRMDMEAAKERMRDELAKVDPEIARRLNEGDEEFRKREYHSINCTIADALTGRGGILPLTVITPYEHEIIKILGIDEITREELRETFEGDIKTLEDRINQLINNKMEQSPQNYGNVVSVNRYRIVVDYQPPATIKYIYGESEEFRTFADDEWEKNLSAAELRLGKEQLEDLLSYLPDGSVITLVNGQEIPAKVGVPENIPDLDRVKKLVKRWLELKTGSSPVPQHTI